MSPAAPPIRRDKQTQEATSQLGSACSTLTPSEALPVWVRPGRHKRIGRLFVDIRVPAGRGQASEAEIDSGPRTDGAISDKLGGT